MKRLITILLALFMLFLPACGGNSDKDNAEVEIDTSEQIVDTRLDNLIDHGWTKNESNYTLEQSSDYSDSQVSSWIEGDDLVIEINYEYGDRNDEMRELYSDGDSVTMSLAARWFADIESITGESFTNMKYTVTVGGEQVGNGTVAEAVALESAAEYDD